MQSDLGIPPVQHGNLVSWAKQGVLLLNTVLTVREGQAYSHRGQGWEQLTDAIIERLNEREKPIVFILWGKPAQEKIKMIDTTKHAIIATICPSRLLRVKTIFKNQSYLDRMGRITD